MDLNAVAALSNQALKQPSKKKQIKIVSDEEIILADGSTMEPLPVKTSSDVLRASLLMLFKHVADIHISVVEIVADKFKIPIEDLHTAITDDPRCRSSFGTLDFVFLDVKRRACQVFHRRLPRLE